MSQDANDELKALARQQAAVAQLGQLALSRIDVPSLSDRVVKIIAEILNVEYCKILEFLPDNNAFLLRAGVGWKRGLVGSALVGAEKNSQAGYTLLSSEPVIVKDLRKEKRFNGPQLLFDHGVVSGMSVIIHGEGRPFGVLGVHTTQERVFSRDDVNFLQAVANILADAIGRRQMEEALQKSEENFRALAENANDGILISTGQGAHVYANRRAGEIAGYTTEELLRMTIRDLAHPDEFPKIIEQFKKRVEGKSVPSQYETVIVRRDGKSVPIEITASRTIWKGWPASLVIIRDATERKRFEAEMLRTSKLESLGVLAGGIAHDYNNILTAIMANISFVKTYTHPGDLIYERLTEAEKATLRARDLTHQLMTFAKGGMPVKKTISITQLVRDSAALALSGTNIKYVLSMPEDTWPVEADEGQMNQVFHNLLVNAAQAMPAGGTVHVACENIAVEGREEKENIVRQNGKYVKVSVRDHGVGIPAEHLSKIFDPYFTTKKKGNGLGLATAYSIVKNHDGYISVDSAIGAGSAFDVHLPASLNPTPKEAEADESPYVGAGRILIMDDEEIIRAAAGSMLKRIGYEVDFAANGKEAIEIYKKAKESQKPFDAVIMDLTIPGGMGGEEAIRGLLAIDPKVKAVVSSGYHNNPVMADYKRHGFCAILPKPYRIAELSKTLYNLLKKETRQ
ncbi:MAG: PAS domain S-box protein [Nitrospirae bacterium]|nr:PAS domain S-box protein [Nitrospirota bacterium]